MRRLLSMLAALAVLSASPQTSAAATGFTAPVELGRFGVQGTATAVDGTTVSWGVALIDTKLRFVVQVRPPGGPIGAVQDLAPAPAIGAQHDLAVGPAGHFMAAWLQDGNIRTAVMRPGESSFGDVRVQPSRADSPGGSGLHVAVDHRGMGHLLWVGVKDKTHVVNYGARLVDGTTATGGIHALVQESASTLTVRPDAIAVNREGEAAVVWSVTETNNTSRARRHRVELATSPFYAAWSTPKLLVDAEETSDGVGRSFDRVDVGLNDAGDVVTAWESLDREEPSGPVTAGTGFRAGTIDALPVVYENPSAGSDSLPSSYRIGLDEHGRTRASWLDVENFETVIRTRLREPRAPSWGDIQTLRLPGARNLLGVGRYAMATSPSGAAVIAFVGTSGFRTFHAATAAPGAPFSGSTAIAGPFASEGNDHGQIRPSLSDGGDGVIALLPPGEEPRPLAVGVDGAPPRIVEMTTPDRLVAGASGTFAVRAVDTWSAVTPAWSFGDGTSAVGETVEHVYASGGDRTVTVTATDAFGNTSSGARPVAVSEPPAPPPPVTGGPDPVVGGAAVVADLLPPRLSRLRVVKRRLVFVLSEEATVRITFRYRGKRVGVVTRKAAAGVNRVRLPSRLRAGRLRATLIATDAAGNRSASAAIRFRVSRS